MFRSLRWKFTAWYVAISVLVAVVVGLAIFYAESRALSHRLEGSIRGAGDAARAATAANLERSSQTDPLVAASQAVETVAAHRGLNADDVHVVLLDSNGLVLANPENVDVLSLARGGSIERALLEGEYWHNTRVSGNELRVKTFPLSDSEGELIGFVQAAKSTEDTKAALRTLILVMTGSGLIGLIIFALGGYLLAGKAIQPVQKGYELQRQFVADASHELRTPITVIRTNADILSSREHDQAIEDIAVEARYMSRLIENLLLLASADRGLHQHGSRPIDLAEVARSAGRSAQMLATSNGISFHEELVEKVVVRADADACRQAIFILLDNAIKYTPAGGEVRLSVVSDGRDGVVEVRDTGNGMTREELTRATERFYSGNKARSRARPGAGLGLSIAKGLTTALNGNLELESEPGKGTSARLRLPLAETRADARNAGLAEMIRRLIRLPIGGDQQSELPKMPDPSS